MLQANVNHEDFTAGAQASQDDALLVKFFIKPRIDNAATEKAGRPVYKDVEHIDIKIAGNRSSGAARPATSEDKIRFARHYTAFKQRVDGQNVVEGTPLKEWPQITASRIEELSFFHVHTVEQLAAMSDSSAGQMMGLMDLKAKAKAWIAVAIENKDVNELRTEFEQMKTMLNDIQSHNAQLVLKNAELEDRVASSVSAELPKKKAKAKAVE